MRGFRTRSLHALLVYIKLMFAALFLPAVCWLDWVYSRAEQ